MRKKHGKERTTVYKTKYRFKFYGVSVNKNSGYFDCAEYIGDLAGSKAFLIETLGKDVAEVEFITHEDKMAQYNGVYIAVNKD